MKFEENPVIIEALKNCKVKTYHVRDDKGKPWATLVTINNDAFTIVGGAACSPKDVFSKRIGRSIAHARALKGLAQHLGQVPHEHNNPMIVIAAPAHLPGTRITIDTIYIDNPDYEKEMTEAWASQLGLLIAAPKEKPNPLLPIRSIVVKPPVPVTS